MFKYTYVYINYLNINIGKIQNASHYSKNLNTLENSSFTGISLGTLLSLIMKNIHWNEIFVRKLCEMQIKLIVNIQVQIIDLKIYFFFEFYYFRQFLSTVIYSSSIP